MIIANSDYINTSRSFVFFWPDVIVLAGADLDLMQSLFMAIGVQRQVEKNSITVVFWGIKDHLHSRGLLSRHRNPATAEAAVWSATKNTMESIREIVDVLKDGSFQKTTPRAVYVLSPGYAHLSTD